MSVTLIQPTWEDTYAGTLLPADLFRAMARIEETCMRFLVPDGTFHDLQPPKLSAQGFEVVRWIEQIALRDLSFPSHTAHTGTARFHQVVVKIFVKLSSVTAEVGDLQEQYQWVPLAFDKTYAENRTLDGVVQTAAIITPLLWATGQRYGGEWWTGWLLTAQVKLRYTVGAS